MRGLKVKSFHLNPAASRLSLTIQDRGDRPLLVVRVMGRRVFLYSDSVNPKNEPPWRRNTNA
jgi:hypothetical protein